VTSVNLRGKRMVLKAELALAVLKKALNLCGESKK